MKNQRELDILLDKLIQKAENEVDKIYARRMKNVLAEVSAMYEKYEVNGVLSMADMTKFNRLQKSMDVIIGELTATYAEAYKLTQTTMEEQYIESYFRMAYLAEFEAQKKMGFGSILKATIVAAVKNPIEHLTLSKVMERNRAGVIYKIQQIIADGLIAGKGYATMARQLRERLDIDRRKARLIARTEAARAQSLGKEAAYEKINKYVETVKVWDSTLDQRTRQTHRKLDGQKADKDGYFHYNGLKAKAPRLWNVAAMDIQCRCATRLQIEGREPTVRRARNDDGTTSVIPWTIYEEWHKNRIK